LRAPQWAPTCTAKPMAETWGLESAVSRHPAHASADGPHLIRLQLSNPVVAKAAKTSSVTREHDFFKSFAASGHT
jgi:hypothetical protein